MEAKAQVFHPSSSPFLFGQPATGSRTYRSQEAELAVDRSPTREAALEKAILAAELYMTATKHASSDRERARLRSKCQQLTSRAESIKKSASWVPLQSKDLSLKAPVSQRAISTREEIILLEGSRLHGFIFPQWTSDPDDAAFEEPPLAYTCVLYFGPFQSPC
jgi:hypothetical protein